MSLLTSLLLLIVSARLIGRLFIRFNQPGLIGEMLAGVIVGPTLLNLIQPTPPLSGLADLAVFFIIVSSGLEMRFKDIMSALNRRGLLLSFLSFTVPFGGGFFVAEIFELDLMRKIFIGLCISITALPVAIKLMENLGIHRSRISKYAIATAVTNDVAALFILGIVLNFPQDIGNTQVIDIVLQSTWKLITLIVVVLTINSSLEWLHQYNIGLQWFPNMLRRYLGIDAIFGLVIIFVLAFGAMTEMLGFHFVIGTFFGALLLDKRQFLATGYQELKTTLDSMNGGFLAPVFFAYLGLKFQLDSFKDVLFPAAIITTSIATKLFAGWLGGRIIGMPHREAIGLGCVLNGRGVMELIVAGIAYQKGFIGASTFSTLVLMGGVTTFLTPVLFKWVFPTSKLDEYRLSVPERPEESIVYRD